VIDDFLDFEAKYSSSDNEDDSLLVHKDLSQSSTGNNDVMTDDSPKKSSSLTEEIKKKDQEDEERKNRKSEKSDNYDPVEKLEEATRSTKKFTEKSDRRRGSGSYQQRKYDRPFTRQPKFLPKPKKLEYRRVIIKGRSRLQPKSIIEPLPMKVARQRDWYQFTMENDEVAFDSLVQLAKNISGDPVRDSRTSGPNTSRPSTSSNGPRGIDHQQQQRGFNDDYQQRDNRDSSFNSGRVNPPFRGDSRDRRDNPVRNSSRGDNNNNNISRDNRGNMDDFVSRDNKPSYQDRSSRNSNRDGVYPPGHIPGGSIRIDKLEYYMIYVDEGKFNKTVSERRLYVPRGPIESTLNSAYNAADLVLIFFSHQILGCAKVGSAFGYTSQNPLPSCSLINICSNAISFERVGLSMNDAIDGNKLPFDKGQEICSLISRTSQSPNIQRRQNRRFSGDNHRGGGDFRNDRDNRFRDNQDRPPNRYNQNRGNDQRNYNDNRRRGNHPSGQGNHQGRRNFRPSGFWRDNRAPPDIQQVDSSIFRSSFS